MKLQTWSYALSSLVAWQLQAASALASQASQADEADKLMALSLKTRAALRQASAQPEAQAQGLDQLWPLHLGLEDDPARAKALLEALLLPLLSQDPPLQEQGALHPWRAYLWVRLLAQYGYRDQARAAAKALAGFLAKTPVLWSAYAAQPQGAPGDLATASAALGLALERYEQEAFLLPWTRNLEGRILQVRSLDGRIYMKRLRLPAAKAPYAKLRLASPKGGAILDEKAWIFDCDEPAVLSLVSETPLQVAELGKNKKILFKETTRADMIVKKGVKYEVLLKER